MKIGGSNLKKICILTILFLLPGCVPADQPSTNEQFFVNTISELTVSLIDSLALEKTGIYIEPEAGLVGLAVDGFKSGAIISGLAVRNNGDEKTGNDYVVALSLSSFNFDYQKGQSRGFLKKARILRRLSGQVLININRSDFNFIGFKDFSGAGQIDPTQLNYVKSLRYNQLSPDPPGSGIMKYLEPFAVTATVGGLIYLFFINR